MEGWNERLHIKSTWHRIFLSVHHLVRRGEEENSLVRSDAIDGHGGHKISTLEQSEKFHFNRCFQWLIKEMKCTMPLHATIFWRSFFKFFILGQHVSTLTALLWFQNMNAGGSGELCTTHVRFIVEPLSMYKSGAPTISVDGSVWETRGKWENRSNQS